jgi:N-acetylglucosamine-6-phosphate deacetylase
MEIVGRRYDTGEAVRVEIADNQIGAVAPLTTPAGDLPWLAPGFIDLQVNGYLGVGFNDANLTTTGVEQVCQHMARFGVTRFLPTCTTDGAEQLSYSLHTLAAACEQSPRVRQAVPGIHLEGPYISPEDGPRGAHPRQHVRPPDWEEFQRLQDSAQGMIRLVTLSPEYAESPRFIERAVAAGVVVSLGHTKANTQQIADAVSAGAQLSTHLGNGAHPLIRRHPNYIWDQLADDRLSASLIVDGHHLPPAVVKVMVRAKSPEKCVLVSDVTNLGGMPVGEYSTSLGNVEILPDGRLVGAGQRELLAGASQPITVNIAKVMEFTGVTLKTAVDMATFHPGRLLGWPVPFLTPGDEAALVVFDLAADGLHVRAVHR